MPGSTARYVGVDGCKAGWVGIGLYDDCACDEKGWDTKVCKEFGRLVEYYGPAKMILVDMPIGLPNDEELGRERIEYRCCDKQARNLLGSPRLHSVFPVPTKELACEVKQGKKLADINKELKGRCARGMSQQTYGIARKILECADVRASPDRTANIREIHPELCFWALNEIGGKNQPMCYGKHDGLGFLERFRIVKSFVPDAEEICKKVRSGHSRNKVGTDDILDALVAAITAKLGCQNQQYQLCRLPGNEPVIWNAPTDGREMLYVVERQDQ